MLLSGTTYIHIYTTGCVCVFRFDNIFVHHVLNIKTLIWYQPLMRYSFVNDQLYFPFLNSRWQLTCWNQCSMILYTMEREQNIDVPTTDILVIVHTLNSLWFQNILRAYTTVQYIALHVLGNLKVSACLHHLTLNARILVGKYSQHYMYVHV